MSNRRFYVVIMMVAVFIVSGCSTSLKVTKYSASNKPVDGVIYYLPQSEFSIDAKYVVTGCPVDFVKTSNDPTGVPGFKVKVTADLTQKSRSNLKDAYVIDYTTLQAATKDHDFEVTLYENGMLKSINSTSKDKTGEMVLSVAGAAAKLALVNTTGPAGLLALTKEEETIQGEGEEEKIPLVACSQKVDAALKNLKQASKDEKSKLEAANLEKEKVIKKKEEIISAGGDLVNDDALKGMLAKLEQAFELYLEKKKAREELEKILMVTKKHSTVGTSGETFIVSKENISEWLMDEDDFSKKFKKLNGIASDSPEVSEKIKNYYDDQVSSIIDSLQLKFSVETADKVSDGGGNSTEYEGVVYRQTATAVVKVCLESECKDGKYLQSKDIQIPDAGPLAVLPFKNEEFQENTFAADFSEAGSLTRLKVTSNSTAAAQAKLFGDLADLRMDYKTKQAVLNKAEKDAAQEEADALLAKEESELKKQREEELGALEHQIALLKSNQELSKLTASPKTDDELEALQRALTLQKIKSDIALMQSGDAKAELERITSEMAIEDLLYE